MDTKVSALPVSEEFLLLAKKILKGASALRRVNARQSSAKDWARHLLALVELDGLPKEEVLACFCWYSSNLDGEYVPRAYGESMRSRYGAILDAYQRALGITPQKESTLVISEDAARLAKTCLALGWPAALDPEQLPGAVQATLDFYRRLRATLQRLQAHPVAFRDFTPERVAKWASRLDAKIGSATNMTEVWWHNYVHDKVCRRPNWDGDLKKWTLSATHPELRLMYLNKWMLGDMLTEDIRTSWFLFQQEIQK